MCILIYILGVVVVVVVYVCVKAQECRVMVIYIERVTHSHTQMRGNVLVADLFTHTNSHTQQLCAWRL
jgi:hypothetical protein